MSHLPNQEAIERGLAIACLLIWLLVLLCARFIIGRDTGVQFAKRVAVILIGCWLLWLTVFNPDIKSTLLLDGVYFALSNVLVFGPFKTNSRPFFDMGGLSSKKGALLCLSLATVVIAQFTAIRMDFALFCGIGLMLIIIAAFFCDSKSKAQRANLTLGVALLCAFACLNLHRFQG
jgi:ABC-type nickel/cobalt efflux system permease component RcnA